MTKDDEARWWRENFPTVSARLAADRAIDKLDPREPMSKFVDVWIRQYKLAGGKRGR